MSRNQSISYTQYVHEFTNERGETRYAVAEWDEKSGEYTRPLTHQQAQATGCFAEFCHNLNYFGGYKTRKEALRRARYLFGQDSQED